MEERMPLVEISRLRLPALLPIVMATTAAAQGGEIERGRYLASIMDCGGCHTRGVFLGQPNPDLYLAGSEVGFHLPGLGYGL
jgi:hypothetical protein